MIMYGQDEGRLEYTARLISKEEVHLNNCRTQDEEGYQPRQSIRLPSPQKPYMRITNKLPLKTRFKDILYPLDMLGPYELLPLQTAQ